MVILQFTPVRDFYSEELKSHYTAGMTYSCKPDKAEHAKLKDLLPTWVKDGRVVMGVAATGGTLPSRVSGKGTVSDTKK